MLPLRNILCPTDFSDPSYVALHAATELAEYFDAHLTVVHIIPTIPALASPIDGLGAPAMDVARYAKEMTVQSEKLLAEIVHDRVPRDVDTRLVVTYGEPADEILAAADRESVDTIVIATHGRTGWRRFLFGSVAEKIVRCAVCPVLTIHQPVETDEEKGSERTETAHA